jgi:uracil-DNA glycosylase
VKAFADTGGVAILWGTKAQEVAKYFSEDRLIVSPHPSPLSAYRGFFGSKPFSRANAALAVSGQKGINWEID